MSTPCRTSKSSSTKKKHQIHSSLCHSNGKHTAPAIGIPDIGRTLSYAELRIVHGNTKCLPEIPTTEDFKSFHNIMHTNTNNSSDSMGRITTTFSTVQPLTALGEEELLSLDQKAIVAKVVRWLHRLLPQ